MITIEPGSVMRLRAAGEFDLANRVLLGDAVRAALAAGHGTIEIDLRDVTFIDVSVVRLLLRCHRLAGLQNRRVRVVNAHGTPALVLAVTGARDLLCPAEKVN